MSLFRFDSKEKGVTTTSCPKLSEIVAFAKHTFQLSWDYYHVHGGSKRDAKISKKGHNFGGHLRETGDPRESRVHVTVSTRQSYAQWCVVDRADSFWRRVSAGSPFAFQVHGLRFTPRGHLTLVCGPCSRRLYLRCRACEQTLFCWRPIKWIIDGDTITVLLRFDSALDCRSLSLSLFSPLFPMP